MLLSKRCDLKNSRKYQKRGKLGYSSKKYVNPFFPKKKRKKINLSLFSWRAKLIIFEIILVIGGIIWFCCFSAYFTIEMIDVVGAEIIAQDDINNLAWQQTERKRFLLGSQKNLILFNANRLTKILNEQYCLDNLIIEKKFPNTLIIKFKEKTYSVIWHELDKYYYVDAFGNIITETSPLEIKQKDYPLIDYKGENRILDKKINNQHANINYIIQLFNKFKKTKDVFEIERFIIDNEVNTIKMVISQGPKIYFNIREDIDKQINKLIIIVSEKLKDDFMKKSYIDLRYGDRVYYR